MKVAVIIAKFPSGWRSLAVDEDLVALRQAFKTAKVEGSLVHQKEAAETVLYFDTGGILLRKQLRTPDAAASAAGSQESALQQISAAEVAQSAAKAKADGSAAAQALAEKAVSVLVAGLTPGATIPPTFEDAAKMAAEIQRLQELASTSHLATQLALSELDALRAEHATLRGSLASEGAPVPEIPTQPTESVSPGSDTPPAATSEVAAGSAAASAPTETPSPAAEEDDERARFSGGRAAKRRT